MLRYLLDTNVLVYTLDNREPVKQAQADQVVQRLGMRIETALPAQALAEFARVVMAKLQPPVTPDVAYKQIELYEQSFQVLPLTPAVVLEAVRGVRDHAFAYFDAQIWALAHLSQIPFVLSEDFASGSTVEGVTFLNPFDGAFDIATL